MSGKSVQHLQFLGIHDEWETPKSLLRSAMINYDILPFLDVCATPQNAQFSKYFTKEQNGLLQNWTLNFFMNPPYSQIYQWIQKASNEVQNNKVSGLALTFAKTDTKWWHQFVEGIHEVHFIKGRIKFLRNGVPSKNSAPYPSCWIVMRP